MKITPPTRKRQISPSSGSLALVAMRKSAAGPPANAKRSAAISAGPKPARPARIAGKEEAQALTVQVTVTNTGERDAYEVVQLYVRDPFASVSRPVKELKGFRRVLLKAGESREVMFDITEKDLSYYNAEGETVFEPGEFHIMLGHDSSSLQTVKVTAE